MDSMDTMKRYKWIIHVRIYKMCLCVCVFARALLTVEHGRLQDRCERLRLPQRKQQVRLKLKKQSAFLPPCWNYKWGGRVQGIRQQLASKSSLYTKFLDLRTSICLWQMRIRRPLNSMFGRIYVKFASLAGKRGEAERRGGPISPKIKSLRSILIPLR